MDAVNLERKCLFARVRLAIGKTPSSKPHSKSLLLNTPAALKCLIRQRSLLTLLLIPVELLIEFLFLMIIVDREPYRAHCQENGNVRLPRA